MSYLHQKAAKMHQVGQAVSYLAHLSSGKPASSLRISAKSITFA